MAAITPSSTIRESVGDLTLYIATFAATADDADYWTSKIPSVVGYWANATDSTTGEEGIDVALTVADSVFTFNMGEDDRGIMLYVLSRS